MKTKLYKKAIVIIVIIVIGMIAIMGILGFGAVDNLREINEEKSFSMNEINGIQVDIGPQNVHFIESIDSEVKLHLKGKAMHDLKIVSEIKNKILYVKLQRESCEPYEKVVLDIYVPKEYGKKVSINMSTGSVKMDSFDLTDFIYKSSTGQLEVENINAEKISINTATGGVDIKKLGVKKLDIKGESGSININECIVKEGRVETTTGNINLKNSSGALDAKSGSGKILIDYKEFENQNINIQTTSGNVTLKIPDNAEFLLDVKTSTGGLKSDFAVNTAGNTDKKKIEGQIGTKSNKVLLQTSTGNINILKR